MGRFVSADRVRLDMGGGDWVELKGQWTMGDRRAIRSAISHVEIGMDPIRGEVGETKLSINMEAGEEMTVRRGILAWGGPGFCQHDHSDGSEHSESNGNGCKPVPVSPERFDALNGEDSAAIVQKLNELNPEPKAKGPGVRP